MLKKMRSSSRTGKILLCAPAFAALVLVFLCNLPGILSPILQGDAGFRLQNSDTLFVKTGFRYWLPGLQAHIMVLHRLRAPLPFYLLVPFFYYGMGLVCINLIAWRMLRPAPCRLIILCAAFILFSFMPLVTSLSFDLYQEMLCFGLFQLALYIYWFHQRRKIFLVVVVIAGVLTREYFWFYLISFFVIQIALRVAGRPLRIRYKAAAIFTLVILAWLWSMKIDMIRKFHDMAPYAHISDLVSRVNLTIENISSENQGPFFLCALIAATYLLLTHWKKVGTSERSGRFVEYTVFSGLSLLFIYSYAIWTNAWGLTPYNPRMVFPFLIHMPAMLILLLRESSRLKNKQKALLCGAVFASMCYAVAIPELPSPDKWHASEYHRAMSDLSAEYMKSSSYRSSSPHFCITGFGRWYDYANYIVEPLLYESKELIVNDVPPPSCDIVLSSRPVSNESYFQYSVIDSPAGKLIYVQFRKLS